MRHCQISGTAQKSQNGSAGPPAAQAAIHGIPMPSQITQEGGTVTKAVVDAGAADTSERVVATMMVKKEDFILRMRSDETDGGEIWL